MTLTWDWRCDRWYACSINEVLMDCSYSPRAHYLSYFWYLLRWILVYHRTVRGIRWIGQFGQWIFKSIIIVNEDTAAGLRQRVRVHSLLSHTHIHIHTSWCKAQRPGLRQQAVLVCLVCILWGACDDEQCSRLYTAAVLNSLNWVLSSKIWRWLCE